MQGIDDLVQQQQQKRIQLQVHVFNERRINRCEHQQELLKSKNTIHVQQPKYYKNNNRIKQQKYAQHNKYVQQPKPKHRRRG